MNALIYVLHSSFTVLLNNDKSRIVSRFENHGRRKGKPARLRISDVGSSIVTVTPPNPTDGGVLTKSGLPLYLPGGPVQADINQGELSDCWVLSGAGALCLTANGQAYIQTRIYLNPTNTAQVIVTFTRSGTTTLVTMDELESSEEARDTTAMWPEALEKAYAFFRTGADTYASLDNGLASGFWSDFGLIPSGYTGNSSAASTIAALAGYLKAGQPCTMLTPPNPGLGLVPSHCFMVESADAVNGLVLRNPWGNVAGQLIYNITPAQLIPANLSYYEYGAAPPVAPVVPVSVKITADTFPLVIGSASHMPNGTNGGPTIGGIQPGDIVGMNFTAPQALQGKIALSMSNILRLVSPVPGSFDLYLDMVHVGTIQIPSTSASNVYELVNVSAASLSPGMHSLFMIFRTSGLSLESVVVS